MIVGLPAAFLSAASYGIASVLQASAARKVPGSSRVDARLLARLATKWPFIAGVLLDVVGFVAQFVSLRALQVFVVQAIQASNLAVTAVVAIPVLGARLRGREWSAVGVVCAGIAMLALSAGFEQPVRAAAATGWGLLGGAAAVAIAGYALGAVSRPSAPAILGFVAGLGFGVVALSARALTDLSLGHLVGDPALYALALSGIMSFLFYATALQRGAVTTVTAAVVVGETLLPSLVGVLLLGDRPRQGMVGLAIIGYGVAVGGAVMLARFGEPQLGATEPDRV